MEPACEGGAPRTSGGDRTARHPHRHWRGQLHDTDPSPGGDPCLCIGGVDLGSSLTVGTLSVGSCFGLTVFHVTDDTGDIRTGPPVPRLRWLWRVRGGTGDRCRASVHWVAALGRPRLPGQQSLRDALFSSGYAAGRPPSTESPEARARRHACAHRHCAGPWRIAPSDAPGIVCG